ncbi:dTDP-4-amino-4,6-dideoxygalactose transaminase [Saccharothrix ecbatanensis]|uniref:dTDP-4-amino-4,6-dideoxygalactose transaminase n=1 Tax=Saccharothrix ecbatanensis TaxID=1105145 RepID=A0A7W9HDM7_9PSEU|nr:DegT/DnrJ/EryC1/StrS family aminotransferase [Saccharothrix ecbatanensis]MBB5800270.1 dTDP-4-amino-4,6-dideoxygalactose transaminase [Saccharothrix ecbatanensis]
MIETAASIDHNAPLITDEDRAAVDRVLRSGWIAPGPERRRFEADLTGHFGGGAAVATTSGTLALFLSMVGLDLPEGASVAVPTYSCVALLDAVRLAGCHPLVVDVDPDDLTMSPQSLADVSRRFGPVDAAIVVHTYGATAPLPDLRQHSARLVEDCCQSFGTNGPYGQHGNFGEIAVSSLYATKVITGATGGFCWTADPDAAARMHRYTEAGFRSRRWPRLVLTLSDVHAALARSQLARLDGVRARRAWIADQFLSACPARLAPIGLPDAERVVYRFVLRCADEAERERLHRHFRQRRIDASRLIQGEALLHRELGLDPRGFPSAEAAVTRTLSLPLHPSMSDDAVRRICDALAALPS